MVWINLHNKSNMAIIRLVKVQNNYQTFLETERLLLQLAIQNLFLY